MMSLWSVAVHLAIIPSAYSAESDKYSVLDSVYGQGSREKQEKQSLKQSQARRWVKSLESPSAGKAESHYIKELKAEQSAGSDKRVVAHIQCQVCEMMVEVAWNFTAQGIKNADIEARDFYKQKEAKKTEEHLEDLADNICSIRQPEGKWITRLDIARMGPGDDGPLKVQKMDEVGECEVECRTIKKTCLQLKKANEDNLKSILKKKPHPNLKDVLENICEKSCSKKRKDNLPELTNWKDYPFVARHQPDVAREDVAEAIAAEKRMPGIANPKTFIEKYAKEINQAAGMAKEQFGQKIAEAYEKGEEPNVEGMMQAMQRGEL